MQLLPDEIRVARLNATAADTLWTGSVALPRGCGTPAVCQARFVLNADHIALGELREWVSTSPEKRPWYLVLEPNAKTRPSFLANVRASGELTTDRLQVQRLEATGVSAKVSLDSGEWQADFSVKPAICKGSGSITAISLTDLADAMKDGWIAGIANVGYEVKG